VKKRRAPKKGAARAKKTEPPKKQARPKQAAARDVARSDEAKTRREIREKGISAAAKTRKRSPATLRRWLREGFPDPVRSAVAKITANPVPARRRKKALKITRARRAKEARERRELAQAAKGSDRKERARKAARLKETAPKFIGMSSVDILLWAEEYDYDVEEIWDAYDEQ
jgi:TolB-like protein